jgi:hypothetical protein
MDKIASMQGWPNDYHTTCITILRAIDRAPRWVDVVEATRVLQTVHRMAEDMRREILGDRNVDATYCSEPQPATKEPGQ